LGKEKKTIVMPEDCVLRCLVQVQIAGKTIPVVFDAVQEGSEFIIVSAWGSRPDDPDDRQTPKEFFKVPVSEVEPAPPDSKDYELICIRIIEWDAANIIDISAPLPRSFQLPPDD
jgi:hypothetical protein